MNTHSHSLRSVTIAAVAATALLACTKAKDTPARPDDSGAIPTRPVESAPAAAPADAATGIASGSCDHTTLVGLVTDAQVAMDPLPALRRARAVWTNTPSSCRDATWYLMAAHLLRLDEPPLEVEALRLTRPRQALAAGLELAGEDAALLVFVAYLAAVDPAAGPVLPEAACARVERAPARPGPAYVTTDSRHYVCGLVALRDRDFATAATHLAALEDPRVFPDADLRLAEALAGSGDQRGAVEAARRAAELRDNRGRAFGATATEIETIRTAAKTLLELGG